MMRKTPQSIYDQAMRLSEDDRADLIARLQASIHPRMSDELKRAWAQEAERRVDQLTTDNACTVDADPILDRIQRGQRP
jgi:putative addiction module component (TIGR02574 family)